MKKVKEYINRCLETLNRRWMALPVSKQNRYVLYFFVGYLLLTLMVILSPCFENGKALRAIQKVIPDHPNAVADSLLKTLKQKFYERK